MAHEIEIIHEEPGWMVVSKPCGLSVHNPEDGQNLLEILGASLKSKFYAVHRLDKETSGVMLLAKNKEHAGLLQEALTLAQKVVDLTPPEQWEFKQRSELLKSIEADIAKK